MHRLRLGRGRQLVDPARYRREDGLLAAGEWIEHLDGTNWFSAEAPRRLHRCWPQTRARLDGELVERCACGSYRLDGWGPWILRNRREAA